MMKLPKNHPGWTLCLTCLLAWGGAATMAGGFPAGQDTFELTSERVPESVKLGTFVRYLVATAQEVGGEKAASHASYRLGLDLEAEDLDYLVELFGDFLPEQRERLEREGPYLEHEPEQLGDLARDMTLKLQEHTGRVLGGWLAGLRRKGHDVEGALVKVVLDQGFSVSNWSLGGEISPFERMEEEAAKFDTGFLQGFGRSIHAILESE